MRKLIDLCNGLKYNSIKNEILVFFGAQHPRYVPSVRLSVVALKIVKSFTYLGHVTRIDLRDDEDVERERRVFAVRTNMIAHRFARRTADVKVTLFKAFCPVILFQYTIKPLGNYWDCSGAAVLPKYLVAD